MPLVAKFSKEWYSSSVYEQYVSSMKKMKFYEDSIVHNPKLELQNVENAKKVSH